MALTREQAIFVLIQKVEDVMWGKDWPWKKETPAIKELITVIRSNSGGNHGTN